MRLLSLSPRIRKDAEDRLIAVTAWRVRIFLLWLIYRKVIVDPAEQTISVKSRYLWIILINREWSFAQVQAVTYGYQDLSPESWFSFAHHTCDCFSVGIRRNDEKEQEVVLFKFYGEGTFENHGPLPDWMYWEEYAFDLSGSQQKTSKVFVELLSNLLNVTVVPPRPF